MNVLFVDNIFATFDKNINISQIVFIVSSNFGRLSCKSRCTSPLNDDIVMFL
jgi:hypothetical protein